MSNIKLIETTVFGLERQFNSVLSKKTMNFNREAEFAVQAISKSDYSIGIAVKNPQSVIEAVINVAAIGLSLNPALKEAYLVPRKTQIVLDISYLGYCKLATESGSIEWVQAHNVYSSDTFILNGIDKEPTFTRDPFSTERGNWIGTFCTAKTSSGAYLTHVMSAKEINDIKKRSQSVQSGKTGAWDTDPGEMQKKSCIKQGSKSWPRIDALAKAIDYSNKNGEGIDFNSESNPEYELYENTHLPTLQLAASKSPADLQVCYQNLPKCSEKKALWINHGASLKTKSYSLKIENPITESNNLIENDGEVV
jgi:recombination protein RecT